LTLQTHLQGSFLTIGYGDINPASPAAKIFFILYMLVSAVVQLTVLGTFLHQAINFRVRGGLVPPDVQV
jgi:Ion channel